jgi:hypothetical protein
MNQTERAIGSVAEATRAPQRAVDPSVGRRLGRATSVMVFLTLVASATNYASNVVFSHLLSTAQYGDFTALIGSPPVRGRSIYTVAIQDRRWVWLLAVGVVFQVASILALHSSPVEIATVQACVVGIVLLANELLFHPILRGERLFMRLTRA